MALPTHGRVLLDTTAGDVDIELWPKVRLLLDDVEWLFVTLVRAVIMYSLQEAPKACRNFIALAMEGTHGWIFWLVSTSPCSVVLTGRPFVAQK